MQEDSKINLWIPRGIVIPSLSSNGNVQRIKIRRTAWQQNDSIAKYIALQGSMNGFTRVGDEDKHLMIFVESELDAYAIHHATSDLTSVIAVGSNIKKPDNITDFYAKKGNVLLCYDNDRGGQAMYDSLKQLYPHAYAYPTPIGKDIGEAIEQGLELRPWILQHTWQGHPHQAIVDYALRYMSRWTQTGTAYNELEKEIAMGPQSSRAKTGELIDGLQLMKQLIENHHR